MAIFSLENTRIPTRISSTKLYGCLGDFSSYLLNKGCYGYRVFCRVFDSCRGYLGYY